MRLVELSPEWVEVSVKEPNPRIDRYIDFRCPKCPDEPMPGFETMRCRIMIPVSRERQPGEAWGWNGEEDFEKTTLTPSIFHHCRSEAHFFITAGEIVMA